LGLTVDNQKYKLKGSESRDEFKYRHKNEMSKSFYACDLDLVLIIKYPPKIVAFLDYKLPRDNVTFTEVIAYNQLLTLAPVYIIRGTKECNGPFVIYQYLSGNWAPDPPTVQVDKVKECETWTALEKWEASIRTNSPAG